MPVGLWDVKDHCEVMVPNEVEARFAQGVADYPDHRAELVAGRDAALGRWKRCLATAHLIDAIRAQHVAQQGVQP
jgi:hypothetical protein